MFVVFFFCWNLLYLFGIVINCWKSIVHSKKTSVTVIWPNKHFNKKKIKIMFASINSSIMRKKIGSYVPSVRHMLQITHFKILKILLCKWSYFQRFLIKSELIHYNSHGLLFLFLRTCQFNWLTILKGTVNQYA